MSRSDAPREQLLKPWHLLIAVVGFAAAFVWIAPARQNLSLNESSSASGISELDVAYVKASRASDPQSSDELVMAASALVRTGRVDEAEALLADRPDVQLSQTDKLTLELERSYTRLNAELEEDAPDQGRLNQYKNAVVLALREIANNSDVNRSELLVRARDVANAQAETRLAGDLAKRLAVVDSADANYWYYNCAETFHFLGELNEAIDCASMSVSTAPSAEARFDAQLLEFSLASKLGDVPRANGLVSKLFESDQTHTDSMVKMAQQFLAAERPADASRTYARLAQADSENTAEWLKQASRWAEASGKPSEAAVYLDILRPQVPSDQHPALDDEIARLLTSAGDSMALLDRYQKKIEGGDVTKATLEAAIAAAIANSETETATQWNQLLVQNNPESVAGWVNQYKLRLASGDLPSALSAAKTLVDLEPGEVTHHVRLAQVAEWTGDPGLATAQWLWVSERSATDQSLTELVRLSKATFRPALTAEALRQQMMREKPNAKQLEELIDAYEMEGTPYVAASVIEELMKRHGNDSHQMVRLAQLHQYHQDFVSANTVWQRYDSVYGAAVISQLHRMELEWRLGNSANAEAIAAGIPAVANNDARALNEATDFQISLFSEIAWRNEISDARELIGPQLERLEDKNVQFLERERQIEIAFKERKFDEAITAAYALSRSAKSAEAYLLHMRMLNEGMKAGDEKFEVYTAAMQPYLVGSSDNAEIRKRSGYWAQVAQYHLIHGDSVMTQRAYHSALEIVPDNPDALTGLLWSYIADDNTSEIKAFIEKYEPLAEESPALWTAFAIAYTQIGMPARSLTWFERQINVIEADYALLLTYADVLEAAGRTEDALKVRHYAIDALRPLLAQGAEDNQDELLQQYARMVAKFGSSDQNERFMLGVIQPSNDVVVAKDAFWQQEMAISWLMATQRQDQARVILAKLHEERLEAPAWQALAVAMKQNDLDVVAQIVQAGQGISVGDNLLALRKLGRENEAYSMAVSGLRSGLSGSDQQMAAQTYRSLREYRPGFAGASVVNTVAPGIGILESSLLARHTFRGTTLSVSVDASLSKFDSDQYLVSEEDDRRDLAVTLHYGDARLNSRITAGYLADDTTDRTYITGGVAGRFGGDKHGYDVQLAMNETAAGSTLLNLRGQQTRASGNVDLGIGTLGFVRLGADVTDITTRISERKVARGVSGLAEAGVRGFIGSHSWSGSIMTTASSYDRVDEVPEELELNNRVTMNEVIGENASTLSIGASLSRGNVAGNYPQVSSPRYYLNARAGHRWPENSFGLQVDAGAGMRIIGGDELSIGIAHDGLVSDIVGKGTSRLGLNYRFHF